MDDVVVPERRRSIRNIPIPEGRRRSDMRAKLSAEADLPPAAPPPPPRHIRPSGGGRKGFWFSLLIGIILIAIGVLSLFKGATVAYVPRTAPLAYSGETYTAYKTSGSGLLYSIVKLSGDKGATVPATGTQQVSRKASGTIVVYNDGADAQPLVATTRFATASGKVYRISSGITVPAKGSVEAVAAADQPGADYNIDPTDFTLPGLQGTPKYQVIYARSKTPMTGGFVGEEKGVSDADLAKAKSDLQKALAQDLIAKAEAQVPSDFVLFPALTSVFFEDLPQSAGDSASDVTINLRGNLYGVMFKRADLATALSLGKAARAPQDPVEIQSYDPLTIAFAGTPPTDLLSATQINFTVSGNALLVWKTDEAALKNDLLAKPKADLPQILKNYQTIEKATATIRPFWQSSFPTSPAEITIKQLGQ